MTLHCSQQCQPSYSQPCAVWKCLCPAEGGRAVCTVRTREGDSSPSPHDWPSTEAPRLVSSEPSTFHSLSWLLVSSRLYFLCIPSLHLLPECLCAPAPGLTGTPWETPLPERVEGQVDRRHLGPGRVELLGSEASPSQRTCLSPPHPALCCQRKPAQP